MILLNRKLSKKYLLIFLFPFGWLLNYLSMMNSHGTEKYYSNGIYKAISWLVGKALGWIPFSIAEIILLILVLVVLWRLVVLIKRMIDNRRDRWILLRNYLLHGLLAASLIYFSFIAMWGLNYN